MMAHPFSTPIPPVSLLDHAIVYVERYGLALCLVRLGSKIPVLQEWNDPHRVLTTRKAVTQAFSHGRYNTGLVHDIARTFAFDVDHLASMRALFAEFGWDYDALFAAYPRIRSREGRDKLIARLPAGFEPGRGGIPGKLKLNWPDPSGECDANGKAKLITVFELRGGANQDVLPPSIHPDTQQPYAWADGQAPWDFADGIPEIPPDHPLLILWAQWDRFRPQLESACPWIPATLKPQPAAARIYTPSPNANIIGQFNRSLTAVEILERNGYKKRGKRWLAPHSSTKIPGVVLLEGGKIFSHHGSDILNTGHAHDAFSVLTILECSDSIHVALEAAARELGIHRDEPIATGINVEAIVKNSKPRKSASVTTPITTTHSALSPPDHLLTIPGRLGDGVAWMLENAKKPQPIYAVQAMLALGATVLGRRYKTDQDNFPSLFLPVLGLSATGKEAIKESIEEVLIASGLAGLIGPSKYTSDSGLLSALIQQPSHLCISDEFGKILEAAADPNNTGARSTLRLMMEVWGRCHGTLRPTGYSTAGMRQDAIDALNARVVYKPALTFVGLATPDSFYDALTRGSLIDGFVNRMLIVESTDPRKPSVFRAKTEPPETLVQWCKDRTPSGFVVRDQYQEFDIGSGVDPGYITIIPFTPAALERVMLFDAFCIEQMNALQADGLAELYGRSNEIAMRLALAVAVSCDSPVIETTHLDWAIDYVSHWTSHTVHQARSRVADGASDAAIKDVERLLKRAGDAGLSVRELRKCSRKFSALVPRAQTDILHLLKQDQVITSRSVATKTKPKETWIFIGEENADTPT